LTVKHILLHYASYRNARDDFFLYYTLMSELFSKVASRSTIYFNKGAGFYHKI